jgi:hypothetical protein
MDLPLRILNTNELWCCASIVQQEGEGKRASVGWAGPKVTTSKSSAQEFSMYIDFSYSTCAVPNRCKMPRIYVKEFRLIQPYLILLDMVWELDTGNDGP